MIRTATLAITSVALAVLVSAAPAAAQVFFNMDFSAGASPSAGWPEAVPTSSTHARSRITGAGPQGEDVYELRQMPTGSSVRDFGGQYYWGWNGYIEPVDPPQGARRFYRWRMRFSPDTNFRAVDSSGARLGVTNKILMVGDTCGRNRCRIIVTIRRNGDANEGLFDMAIDGGETPTPRVVIRTGQWVDIQIEADSSTTTSSADGAFKVWINNNDYSRPSAQITGIQLNPVNWRYVFLGAYNNFGLAPDGVHTFRLAAFQASTTFDAAWSRASTLPGQPNNLRIIPPQ